MSAYTWQLFKLLEGVAVRTTQGLARRMPNILVWLAVGLDIPEDYGCTLDGLHRQHLCLVRETALFVASLKQVELVGARELVQGLVDNARAVVKQPSEISLQILGKLDASPSGCCGREAGKEGVSPIAIPRCREETSTVTTRFSRLVLVVVHVSQLLVLDESTSSSARDLAGEHCGSLICMMADHREPCDAILKGTQRLAAFIVLFREEDCTVRMLFHPLF
eukprot:CAMPEP_0179488026 /NCGR_PEP_ID=MMETSP0799-20121207/63805_1 /TAXON_ID=46947 /ORGANISM="Geminigera cryophila, Strain CCMP2564" /LENGTH=220 /DNA_ID=CAMNT_0021303323 /DNA_START=680 /DNA_END=1343 /DNA_ORIENTATION=+